MLSNDPHFNEIVEASLGCFPFSLLSGQVESEDAANAESLYQAFVTMFHGEDARGAKNVLFIWAVDRPFKHTDGNRQSSTISYIEEMNAAASSNGLSGRACVRDWERHLIRSYRGTHGRRPLKNRQD